MWATKWPRLVLLEADLSFNVGRILVTTKNLKKIRCYPYMISRPQNRYSRTGEMLYSGMICWETKLERKSAMLMNDKAKIRDLMCKNTNTGICHSYNNSWLVITYMRSTGAASGRPKHTPIWSLISAKQQIVLFLTSISVSYPPETFLQHMTNYKTKFEDKLQDTSIKSFAPNVS